MKNISKIVITVIIALLSAFGVLAGLHFSGGAGFGGGSLIADFEIVGISGSRGATVTVTITDGDDLEALCRNRGGKTAPGQNPVDVTGLSTSSFFRADRFGKTSGTVVVDIIGAISAKDAGCPNGNWRISDLYGTIEVELFASDGKFTDDQVYICDYDESDAGTIVDCWQQ